MVNRPIYLHVFDRELRTLMGAKFSDREVCDIVFTGVLATSYCYIGNSNLVESMSEFPNAVKLVSVLEKMGYVKVLTTTISREEFIEERKRLYHQVKDRYPMYFDNSETLFPSRPQVLRDSTTTVLQANILRKLDRQVPTPLIKKVDVIRKAINNRDNNGITIGILGRMIEMNSIERFHTGLLVSENYNKRYLEVMGGSLMKGLPWINIFDDTDQGCFDYLLYNQIMETAFIRFIRYIQNLNEQGHAILQLKENQYFMLFQEMLYGLVKDMVSIKDDNDLGQVRRELQTFLKPRLEGLTDINPEGVLARLYAAKNELEKKYDISFGHYNMKTVLYIVATDKEFERVTDFYKNKGVTLAHFEIKENVYYNLGIIRNSQIFLVKSGMGAKKPDAAILTIKAAAEELKPDYMIMVGIAFGMKEEKEVGGAKKGNQHLGEVMVSSEIEDYGSYKIIEKGIQERGQKTPADATLLKRFSTAFALWDKAKIHTGLIITSDVLVNREEFVNNLKERFPDAIGGEMEGCGFLANYQQHWILVKGICDFGHDKNDEYQDIAAMNAIKFVDFVLREYDL